MKEHKLFFLLKRFSEEEMDKLGDFINSPYFNHNKTIVFFYDTVKNYYPDFDSDELSKKNLFKIIYPGKQFNDSTIRSLFSDTLHLMLNFIKAEEIKFDNLESTNLILRSLIKRDQLVLAEKTIKEAEKNKLYFNGLDSQYLHDLFNFETNVVDLDIKKSSVSTNLSKIIIEERVNKLVNSTVNLKIYFLKEIISAALKIKFYKYKYNVIHDENITNEILTSINIDKICDIIDKKSNYSFVIQLYRALLNLFNDFENEKNYDMYKTLLQKYEKRLIANERTYHYSMLNSYCAVKFNSYSGKRNFKKELLKNYLYMLRNGYYKNSRVKYLQNSFFRGILILAISVKGYKLAEKIINDYSKELKEEDRIVMKNFSLAHLNYERGKLDEAMTFINKIPEDNFIYKYDRYVLIARIFYESPGRNEDCLKHLQNFSDFLLHNTLESEDRKTAHKRFIYYIKNFAEFKLDAPGANKKELITDLELLRLDLVKEKNILLKNWLLEKLDLLIEQYSEVV